MSYKSFKGPAFLIGCCFFSAGVTLGLDRFKEGVAADRERLVRSACNAVSRLTPAQVRDGFLTNVFGDRVVVDAVCWVKGTDGRWRQIDEIIGPDVDAYPNGLRDTYYDRLPEVM